MISFCIFLSFLVAPKSTIFVSLYFPPYSSQQQYLRYIYLLTMPDSYSNIFIFFCQLLLLCCCTVRTDFMHKRQHVNYRQKNIFNYWLRCPNGMYKLYIDPVLALINVNDLLMNGKQRKDTLKDRCNGNSIFFVPKFPGFSFQEHLAYGPTVDICWLLSLRAVTCEYGKGSYLRLRR